MKRGLLETAGGNIDPWGCLTVSIACAILMISGATALAILIGDPPW